MASLPGAHVSCPICGTPLTIPVAAEIGERREEGVVQVNILPNKIEAGRLIAEATKAYEKANGSR